MGGKLEDGAIVGLIGELGSGKTRFVKGVARALKINSNLVKSPTFTLMNIYDGLKRLIHIDLYRVERGEDIIDSCMMDYIYDKNIAIIEWFEKAKSLLTPTYLVDFKICGKKTRKLTIF